MAYQAAYCDKCVHDREQTCPVWLVHVLHNYEECNNKNSILHILIPRDKDGWNEECKMFIQVDGR